ncbi:hypothetical protein ACLOJK_004605 [Asimina triloba]
MKLAVSSEDPNHSNSICGQQQLTIHSRSPNRRKNPAAPSSPNRHPASMQATPNSNIFRRAAAMSAVEQQQCRLSGSKRPAPCRPSFSEQQNPPIPDGSNRSRQPSHDPAARRTTDDEMQQRLQIGSKKASVPNITIDHSSLPARSFELR